MTLQKKEERLLADGQQQNSSSKIKFKKKLLKTLVQCN
jgi:hypothetical protein